MKYVVVDLETTGVDELIHGVVEFGAIIEDSSGHKPMLELPRFERVINTDKEWDPFCVEMHRNWYPAAIRNRVSNTGANVITEEQLLPQFEQWLRVNGVDPINLIGAGKNFATFDLRFLNQLKGWDRSRLHFHRRTIDPTMLYLNPKTDLIPPDTKECLKRAGINVISNQNEHRSISDCFLVILLLRFGWMMRPTEKDMESVGFRSLPNLGR